MAFNKEQSQFGHHIVQVVQAPKAYTNKVKGSSGSFITPLPSVMSVKNSDA